jgi:5-methylcytosine-specific restriction endonuclease McrA
LIAGNCCWGTKPDNTGIEDVLSPFKADRRAVAECTKLITAWGTEPEGDPDVPVRRVAAPRGKNEVANLQVLCSKCNRTKDNRDTTDFCVPLAAHKEPRCVFCATELQETHFS